MLIFPSESVNGLLKINFLDFEIYIIKFFRNLPPSFILNSTEKMTKIF